MHVAPRRASYDERLNRVVDHIYDHLDDDLDLARVAEIACLSASHWHRIYASMRGETVAATLRRLRLQRAADRLANSTLPIADIAGRAGYGSVEAFTRAFREGYGMPPAEYRSSGSHAAFRAARQAADAAGFPVSVVDLPALRCARVDHRGPSVQIDRAFDRLLRELDSHRLMSPETRMIGVFFDDHDLVRAEDLRSAACATLPAEAALPATLNEMVLRPGPYARLRYQGPYVDMQGAYRWLCGVWLPQSGFEPADAPVFEDYLNDPRKVAPSELLTDTYLPLEPIA